MRTWVLVVVMIACGTAGAQECPKYQHQEGDAVTRNCSSMNGGQSMLHCSPYVPVCVDDLHVVTEREWQELQRLIDLINVTIGIHNDVLNELTNRVIGNGEMNIDPRLVTLSDNYLDPEQPQQTAMIEEQP